MRSRRYNHNIPGSWYTEMSSVAFNNESGNHALMTKRVIKNTSADKEVVYEHGTNKAHLQIQGGALAAVNHGAV